MTDKHINAEREATDRLRSELASVRGKIMGIAAFNPPNLKEELGGVEDQIHNALESHRQETSEARSAGITARTAAFYSTHFEHPPK
jgi:hypothetical protein